MDIDLLSRIVKELITDHDKVGLPGLGTFVAEVVPASFSDKGYTINPPYRRLSFHPDNTEADLLVKFYSDSNHVPLEASRVYITEFLSELKQVLIQRKTVIFPGLGRLRATKENNFFFVPDEDLDIYPDGFGLQPVSMKYIQGVADPVDIKLSYSDAMRGFEDRHRAAEPELPAEMGQPAEPMLQAKPAQPSEPGQSSESELTTEPVKPAEPIQPAASQVQPVAEGQPSEQEQPTEPDQAEQEQPSENPSERQCDAAPAEQLQGEERDAASAELPGEERDGRCLFRPLLHLPLCCRGPAPPSLCLCRHCCCPQHCIGTSRNRHRSGLPVSFPGISGRRKHGPQKGSQYLLLPGCCCSLHSFCRK